MTDQEKKICDDMLRYGTILSDREVISYDGRHFRQYVIVVNEDDANEYHLTKMDGEWVFFARYGRERR